MLRSEMTNAPIPMMQDFFAGGKAVVDGRTVSFQKRPVRSRHQMYVPLDFSEDQTLIKNYTYFYSQEKSPLGIAIKSSPVIDDIDRERQVSIYFNQSPHTLERMEGIVGPVYYRELVNGSDSLSVYSLRFAIDALDHILFGCFNCPADTAEHWREIALAMLQNIEEI